MRILAVGATGTIGRAGVAARPGPMSSVEGKQTGMVLEPAGAGR
jgi:hypothetical protein